MPAATMPESAHMVVGDDFPTNHKDLVHHVAYDFYGQRMATCSSDHSVKVWDLQDGAWVLSAELKEKGHTGPVWKVVWGHPEYGQILASCSFDRSVIIWEEQVDAQQGMQWVRRTALVDSRNSVRDIDFAPKHMGLKLVTCSTDNVVRIYEALDVTNLSQWPLMEEFQAHHCRCVSWNPSRTSPPMLGVGTSDPEVKLWVYNEPNRRWQEEKSLAGHEHGVTAVAFAPNIGRSYHLLASGSSDRTIRLWKIVDAQDGTFRSQCIAVLQGHELTVCRLEWNVTGTVLASSADDGLVKLWKAMGPEQWVCVSTLTNNGVALQPPKT